MQIYIPFMVFYDVFYFCEEKNAATFAQDIIFTNFAD